MNLIPILLYIAQIELPEELFGDWIEDIVTGLLTVVWEDIILAIVWEAIIVDIIIAYDVIWVTMIMLVMFLYLFVNKYGDWL